MFRSITVANAAKEQQEFFLADEISFEILRHLSLAEFQLLLLVCSGAKDTITRVIASYSYPEFAQNIFTLFTGPPTRSFRDFFARENLKQTFLATQDHNTGWRTFASRLLATETPAHPNTMRDLVKCILLNPRFACRMIADLKEQGTYQKLLFETLGQNQPTRWLKIFNFLTSVAPKVELIPDLEEALADIIDDVPFHTALKASITLTVKMIAGLMEEVLAQLTPHRAFFANLSGGVFVRKNLKKKNLSGLKLTGCDFQNSDAAECDFSFSDCSQAKFFNAECPDARFIHAILRGVNLDCANLFRANCQSADLRSAPLRKTTARLSAFYFTNFTNLLIDEIHLIGFTISGNFICYAPSKYNWGAFANGVNYEGTAQSATLFILHHRANQLTKTKNRDEAKEFELAVVTDLISMINENSSLTRSFSDVFDECLAKHHMRVNPLPRLEEITTEKHSIFTLISCLIAETKLMIRKYMPQEAGMTARKLSASC
jgi:uncharacterized protein YjbI with pentapeptide repeats